MLKAQKQRASVFLIMIREGHPLFFDILSIFFSLLKNYNISIDSLGVSQQNLIEYIQSSIKKIVLYHKNKISVSYSPIEDYDAIISLIDGSLIQKQECLSFIRSQIQLSWNDFHFTKNELIQCVMKRLLNIQIVLLRELEHANEIEKILLEKALQKINSTKVAFEKKVSVSGHNSLSV